MSMRLARVEATCRSRRSSGRVSGVTREFGNPFSSTAAMATEVHSLPLAAWMVEMVSTSPVWESAARLEMESWSVSVVVEWEPEAISKRA